MTVSWSDPTRFRAFFDFEFLDYSQFLHFEMDFDNEVPRFEWLKLWAQRVVIIIMTFQYLVDIQMIILDIESLKNLCPKWSLCICKSCPCVQLHLYFQILDFFLFLFNLCPLILHFWSTPAGPLYLFSPLTLFNYFERCSRKRISNIKCKRSVPRVWQVRQLIGESWQPWSEWNRNRESLLGIFPRSPKFD